MDICDTQNNIHKNKNKKFVESLKKDMCYSVFDDFRIDKK